MKIIIPLLLLLLPGLASLAQADLQNTGILYVTAGSDILYINGAFTNTTTASFTNNGEFYVLKNLTNGQSAMTTGTGRLYLNGSATQVVGGTQPFKTYNLVTNNSTGITLNSNLDVNGTHTFVSGLITTSATPNYLIYEAGASYTGDGDNAHVNGWVKKFGSTGFDFPVGNNTYERKVQLSNLSATGEFNVFYRSSTPNPSSVLAPLVTIDPNEYWEINKISGGNAQVGLNWNNSKVAFPRYQLASIRAAYYNGGVWNDRGGSAAGNVTTTGAITSNAVSTFGFFAIGSIDFALPVSFLQITAQRKQAVNHVQWKTAQEYNVAYFEVERSSLNGTFKKIGTVKSQQTGTTGAYEYNDAEALPGTVLYRVRSVDKDGQVAYSAIVTVVDYNSRGTFSILNNPAQQAIYLAASRVYEGNYQYQLLTVAGQVVQKGSLVMTSNSIVPVVLSPAVKPGFYILDVHNAQYQFKEQVLIK